MQGNPIKDKLLAGRPVFGTWTIINSPIVAEIMGQTGLDFQILDMEHGVFDMTSLDACIRATEATGCAPLVRVPRIDPAAIQSCLDLGAYGVIVPQVGHHDDAATVAKAAKFPPVGTRGFNPFTRSGRYGADIGGASRKINNQFGLTGIIVENLGAYEDLERILSLDDLDLIYLGVYDMSAALGCMGEMENPKVLRFLEDSVAKIRAAGKAVGLMASTEQEMARYVEMGATFLVYGVDTHLIRRAIRDGVQLFAKVTT